MLVDAQEIVDGETIPADVCVVGAGAAGISLGLALIDTSARVVLLEEGGDAGAPDGPGIYAVAPGRRPTLVRERDRRAGFGGNTAHWSGNCRPLEPADFRRRDWIAHSGWPMSREELRPFYEAAHRLCGLVCLRAHALRLLTDAAGGAVRAVEVAGPGGRRFRVWPRVVVLAAGGVENPRLLLCSTDAAPGGLGNGRDLVGRFFMEHWWVDIPSIRGTSTTTSSSTGAASRSTTRASGRS